MQGMTVEVGELSSAVGVLSAMITPAIMILASGSLLATVSARLGRVVDRVRRLSGEIATLVERRHGDELTQGRIELLPVLLRSAIRRARLLQAAMMLLYLGVGSFVLTSISIGVLSMTENDIGWLALGFGLIGAILLLSASVCLIIESRMAVAATGAETRFVWQWGRRRLSEWDTDVPL
jgi:hypothetical protein